MSSEQIITIIVAVLGSSVISSIISILLPEFLKNQQHQKMIYGVLQFHLARLYSFIENKEAVIRQANKDGVLDYASLQNQGEAMRKIYKVLGNNFQYLEKKHRLSAQAFIDSYVDKSSQRAEKLVNAIELLQKDICSSKFTKKMQ